MAAQNYINVSKEYGSADDTLTIINSTLNTINRNAARIKQGMELVSNYC